jgi:hypothetical protein
MQKVQLMSAHQDQRENTNHPRACPVHTPGSGCGGSVKVQAQAFVLWAKRIISPCVT